MIKEQLTTECYLAGAEGNTPYIGFNAFDGLSGVTAAFSTRLGGISTGEPYASLNLGFGRGDAEDNFTENFRIFAAAVGVPFERLVLSKQEHTVNVRKAAEEDAGKGLIRERDYEGVDGLVTDCIELPLVIFGADCPSIYLVDGKRRAIGFCHAGWKGTLNNIPLHTLKAMKEYYGTEPEDITAVIGPSICADCYEVGPDVYERFLEKGFGCDVVRPGKREGKRQLDLWQANRLNLSACGVKSENIHISGVCSMHNEELFFSHRRQGNVRGCMAGILMLRDQQESENE